VGESEVKCGAAKLEMADWIEGIRQLARKIASRQCVRDVELLLIVLIVLIVHAIFYLFKISYSFWYC